MQTRKISETITEIATKHISQLSTIDSAGLVNPDYHHILLAAGWDKTEAWATYFVKLVWLSAYNTHDAQLAQTVEFLFSTSALATFANFKGSKKFVVNMHPSEGALIVFQYGHTWKGHIGIVTELVKTGQPIVLTIEGSTEPGTGEYPLPIQERVRQTNLPKGRGLNIIGFIHPINPNT